MIAMGIFVAVMGIIVGIFVNSLRGQRNLLGLIAINNNLSLSLEQMTREIRVGRDFSITGVGNEVLIFRINNTEFIAYRHVPGAQTVERGTCTGTVTDCDGTGDFPNFSPIVSSDVAIVNADFFIVTNPATSLPFEPTRVTVVMEVGSREAQLASITTNIQTTVSARNF
jgi:hypothetical protein